MPRLFEITEECEALNDMLAEIDGDISDPEVAEYVGQLFAEFDESFNGKVDNYVNLIREKQMIVACRKEEAERLLMRAKTEQRDIDWLKNTLKIAMQRLGLKKAGMLRTASVCGNGGKTPLDLRVAAEDLPDRFRRKVVSFKVDEAAIREALDNGEELDFANYMERGTHLRVK